MGQSQWQEANGAKGTEFISRALQTEHTEVMELITPVSSGGKVSFPRTEPLTPFRLQSQPQTGFARFILSKDTELHPLCPFIRTSENVLDWSRSQQLSS